MRLSASALKEYTKCGYAFKLKRMDEIPEPGKKSYGMLNGRIIGSAITKASNHLNEFKELSSVSLGTYLLQAYKEEFEKAQVPTDIVGPIDSLLSGIDPDIMMELYILSHSINASEFELKIPPLLKNGSLPNNAQKPTFGAIVLKGYEDLQWFFSNQNIHYNDIRDAVELEHERYFKIDIGDGVEVDGYLDQYLMRADRTQIVSEFKSDKTAYSDAFNNKSIQLQTYSMALGGAVELRLFDISHQRWFTVRGDNSGNQNTIRRYKAMASALQGHIYLPVCGTDPYNDKRILCGYKGNCACPFGSSDESEEVND